jgi:hypothetical protein
LPARVVALTVSPTMGRECVVLAKRERRRRPSPFGQSLINIFDVDEGSLTVYEIHNPTTIASNRSTFSSWLSRSSIIFGRLSRIKSLNGPMSLQCRLDPIVPLLGLTY